MSSRVKTLSNSNLKFQMSFHLWEVVDAKDERKIKQVGERVSSIPDEDPLMAALQTYFFVGSLVPDRICGSLEVRERSVNMFGRVARVSCAAVMRSLAILGLFWYSQQGKFWGLCSWLYQRNPHHHIVRPSLKKRKQWKETRYGNVTKNEKHCYKIRVLSGTVYRMQLDGMCLLVHSNLWVPVTFHEKNR